MKGKGLEEPSRGKDVGGWNYIELWSWLLVSIRQVAASILLSLSKSCLHFLILHEVVYMLLHIDNGKSTVLEFTLWMLIYIHKSIWYEYFGGKNVWYWLRFSVSIYLALYFTVILKVFIFMLQNDNSIRINFSSLFLVITDK
jgi:hypothetical protein